MKMCTAEAAASQGILYSLSVTAKKRKGRRPSRLSAEPFTQFPTTPTVAQSDRKTKRHTLHVTEAAISIIL